MNDIFLLRRETIIVSTLPLLDCGFFSGFGPRKDPFQGLYRVEKHGAFFADMHNRSQSHSDLIFLSTMQSMHGNCSLSTCIIAQILDVHRR